MKSVLKRHVFVFVSALLLLINFSCEKESISLDSDFDAEVAKTSKETKQYKTNLVTADITWALQEKLNNFSKKTKIKNSPSQKDDTSFWINYNNIVELVDSIGNKTYAVQLKSTEPSDRVFYNLIITERIDGSQSNPFVVRYEHDESTTRVEYRYSEDKKFKGKISSYSLESFSNSIINSRGDTSDPCWDDDIDQPDENPEAIGDGNAGSSSGGSGGGGGASSGGFEPTGNSSVGSSRPTAISSPSGDSGITGTVEVGEGCFCDPSAAQQKRMVTLTGKVSDCPEEEIAVPINDVEDFEEKIDDTALNPCLKTILKDLKTLSKGVGYIVQKFAGNTPGFNWEVKDGSLGGATGTTSTKYNILTGTVTTTFDSQAWGNATDLSWARTMMHESIHAYVVASTYNAATIAQKQALLGPDWASAYLNYGHDYIAQNYIKPMADSLQEFGNIKGYHHSRQFYEDMAWGGLHSTSAFNGLPLATQKRINDVILIELTKKDTNGNPKPQKGNNAGC